MDFYFSFDKATLTSFLNVLVIFMMILGFGKVEGKYRVKNRSPCSSLSVLNILTS